MSLVGRLARRWFDHRAARLPERAWRTVGVGVMVAAHNRSGQRVENFLKTLRHQTLPAERVDITVVDYGSAPEHGEDLRERCRRHHARYIYLPTTTLERRRSLAYNVALRHMPEWVEIAMATDIDMIFAPDFLEQVVRVQIAYPPCLTLCRFTDLPEDAMTDDTDVVAEFERLRRLGELYDDCATGPCLAARREWWWRIRGYDERLYGEEHDDYDTQCRAKASGLVQVWIHDRTSLLHQWHWRRYGGPRTEEERAEHERHLRHFQQNREIVLGSPDPVRNRDHEWGVMPEGGYVIEPEP